MTVLMYAAEINMWNKTAPVGITMLFLDRGADVSINDMDKNGKTALVYATKPLVPACGRVTDIAEPLLDRGAQAAVLFTMEGLPKEVELLLERRDDTDYKTYKTKGIPQSIAADQEAREKVSANGRVQNLSHLAVLSSIPATSLGQSQELELQKTQPPAIITPVISSDLSTKGTTQVITQPTKNQGRSLQTCLLRI